MVREHEQAAGGVSVDRVESGRDAFAVGTSERIQTGTVHETHVYVSDGGRLEISDLQPRSSGGRVSPSRRRLLWLGLAMVSLSATLAGWLLRPAPHADIEMDLRVEELGLELAATTDLLADLHLEEVMASNLERLDIPVMGRSWQSEADDVGVVQALLGRQGASPLILNPSWLEPGSSLSLRHLGAKRFLLRLQAPDQEGEEDAVSTEVVRLDVTCVDPVRVRGVHGVSDGFDLTVTSPGSIALAGRGSLELEMTFIELSGGELRHDVEIVELDFSRIEEIYGETELSHRRVSTILGGELVTAAGIYALERGELVRWTRFTGQIRSIRLTGDGLIVKLRGEVTGLSTQRPGGSAMDRMPRVLEEWFFDLGATS